MICSGCRMIFPTTERDILPNGKYICSRCQNEHKPCNKLPQTKILGSMRCDVCKGEIKNFKTIKDRILCHTCYRNTLSFPHEHEPKPQKKPESSESILSFIWESLTLLWKD